MRIVHLVPGTGTFHCGACLRDRALISGLQEQRGHETIFVPLYLPMVLEDGAVAEGPLFLGGVNLYLQEKMGFFRRTPRWLDRVLDAPALLGGAAGLAGMTRAEDLGELTLSSLGAAEGRQAKEWRRLVDWLGTEGKPDVLSLSNGLLMGIAKTVRTELGIPVVVNLQGEDSYIDGLPEDYRERCWEAFRREAANVDRLVAVSEAQGECMRARLGNEAGKVVVVPTGIAVEAFEPAAAAPVDPVIGFFARMCPPKGLHVLVDAFLALVRAGKLPGLRLRVGGAETKADAAYVREQRRKIEEAGCAERVEWFPNVDGEGKREFLRSLSVLSVPTTYNEAFGLYVIEAMASGVPVVQPRRGAFPEIIERTGGGVLVEEEGAAALAAALERLLADEEERSALGRRGRDGVASHYDLGSMVRGYEAVLREEVERLRDVPASLSNA